VIRLLVGEQKEARARKMISLGKGQKDDSAEARTQDRLCVRQK
jgi:hypothetical protein